MFLNNAAAKLQAEQEKRKQQIKRKDAAREVQVDHISSTPRVESASGFNFLKSTCFQVFGSN